MRVKRRSSLFPMIAATVLFLSSPVNNVVAEEKGPASQEKAPYTIKKGDTLWDLSEEHLKNPFLWPNIWEKNKYIRNPDLIYPGRLLVMPYGTFLKVPESGEAEMPNGPAESKAEPGLESNVESDDESGIWSLAPTPAAAPAPAAPPQEVLPTPPPPSAPMEPILPPAPVSPTAPSMPQSMTPKPKTAIAPEPPSTITQRGGMTLAALIEASGYIADRIESSGVISGSLEEKNIYAEGDPVNLLLKDNASVGDRLTIFQPPAPLFHPKTGKRVGMLFVPVGEVEITGVQGRNATGRIIKSFTYSSQGYYVQPYRASSPAVSKMEKEVPDLSGYIIGSHDGKVLNAEYNVVYLDKGGSDGVVPGTTFYVIGGERHDVIGELRVISVQAATSTALVTRSMEPLDIGNKIVTTIK